MQLKKGVLLINLGTPQAATTSAVRRYLKEFLSDARVIDVPTLVRWCLLYLFILPFRPRQSAAAYQQIWQAAGSPLLIHSQAFSQALRHCGEINVEVELAMRYGEPNIQQAVVQLLAKDCQHILILPLFPQYASAATGSALEKALRCLKQQAIIPKITLVNEFYQDTRFITAYTTHIQAEVDKDIDYFLFSYHGLPQRQLKPANCGVNPCQNIAPCPKISMANYNCYRAQCYATTRLIAEKLNLPSVKYTTSFQSRLGRTPWIQPYTDDVLKQLAGQGVKKLAVVCPSFVADCLETLEEMGIRAKEQWRELGGERFQLIPALNDKSYWVHAMAQMINEWIGEI